MNDIPNTSENYAEQIHRCAQALAIAKNDHVTNALAKGFTPEMLKMFTDGNLDKRYEKLVDQLEILSEEIEDLDDMVADYVKTVPLSAYDTSCTDAERFLDRLIQIRELTPEQIDLVTCQRSRHAVEFLAADRRMEHVRFQELSGLAKQFSDDWGLDERLRVYLNPLLVWATFQTRILLSEDDIVPATVVFYPVGDDIRTAVLEDDGLIAAKLLETQGPLTIDAGAWLEAGIPKEDRQDICRDLAEIGLAAFG